MFGSVEAIFQDGENEAGEAESGGFESTGSGYASDHQASIAEVSNRPSGFTDLSPIEKVEKKDVFSQVAILLGVVAILAAVAVAVLSFMMEGA